MFEKVKKILSPEEIKSQLPLSVRGKGIKARRDEIVKSVIAGSDRRKLLIIGPCSADNESAVLEYVSKLAKVCDEVSNKLVIVPRIYSNKPRTRGDGYKGMFHNPDPHKKSDIQEGILTIRNMHIKSIEEFGLSAADEILYPENFGYFDDLLSYATVGARSSENQQHRLVAGGVDIPVGIKNSMVGDFNVLLNSVYSAQIPNEFKLSDYQVRTNGNPYAHAVLRGRMDFEGNNIPNYGYDDIIDLYERYIRQGLKNPAVIIDANHSNSDKDPFRQPTVLKEVMGNIRIDKRFDSFVKGFMIESYLEDGSTSENEPVYGKSITDGCIGWEKTYRLICDIASKL